MEMGSGHHSISSIGKKLPIDIIQVIFSKLPNVTPFRIKLVCKAWNYMVLDYYLTFKFIPIPKPFFIAFVNSKYLPSHPSNSSGYLIMYSIDFDTKLDHGIKFVDRFQLSSYFSSSFMFLNSCHGLLCLKTKPPSSDIDCCILNPMTNEYLKLPKVYGENNSCVPYFGLGFSLKTKQYKIIMITIEKYNEPTVTAVYIFTLGYDHEWRSINFTPFDLYSPGSEYHGVYLNGALYWVGRDLYTDTLWRFDVEDEKFEKISLPRIQSINDFSVYIQVFNGHLYVNLCDQMKVPYRIEVWMMQSHEGEESWIRVFEFKIPRDHQYLARVLLHLIKIDESGEILFFVERGFLFMYDSKNEKIEVIKTKVNFDSILQIQYPNFDSLKKMVAGDD